MVLFLYCNLVILFVFFFVVFLGIVYLELRVVGGREEYELRVFRVNIYFGLF